MLNFTRKITGYNSEGEDEREYISEDQITKQIVNNAYSMYSDRFLNNSLYRTTRIDFNQSDTSKSKKIRYYNIKFISDIVDDEMYQCGMCYYLCSNFLEMHRHLVSRHKNRCLFCTNCNQYYYDESKHNLTGKDKCLFQKQGYYGLFQKQGRGFPLN